MPKATKDTDERLRIGMSLKNTKDELLPVRGGPLIDGIPERTTNIWEFPRLGVPFKGIYKVSIQGLWFRVSED